MSQFLKATKQPALSRESPMLSRNLTSYSLKTSEQFCFVKTREEPLEQIIT